MFRFSRLCLSRYFTRLSANRRSFSTADDRVEKFMSTLDDDFKRSNPDPEPIKERIRDILDKFEYLIYKETYELRLKYSDTEYGQKKLEIDSYDINHILTTKDFKEERSMMAYLLKRKIGRIQRKFERSKNLKAAEEFDEEYYLGGVLDQNNEPIYALWHNCLSTKIRSEDIGRIFHRRICKPYIISDMPTILVDMSYAEKLNFYRTQRVTHHISRMTAFNKLKTYQPFNIELIFNQPDLPKELELSFEKHLISYKDKYPYPLKFNYNIREMNKERSLYCIVPVAKKIIQEEEIMDPKSLFILPGIASNSMRDSMIPFVVNNMHEQGIPVRRLPTTEYVVWNNFHGVLELDIILAILHDAMFDPDFSWRKAFDTRIQSFRIKSMEEMKEISFKRSLKRSRVPQSYNTKFDPYI